MSEIHSAVGAYVVNALDADELEEFEAHLAVCPTCSREVVEFGETAAELSLLASAPQPPAAAGVDQVDGRLGDPVQHGRQVQVAAHRQDGIEQPAKAPGTR